MLTFRTNDQDRFWEIITNDTISLRELEEALFPINSEKLLFLRYIALSICF